jgi:hypothetical protein
VVDLRPIFMVALTLSVSVIVYGSLHWALHLRNLSRHTVLSKSRTLSPTCSFTSPDVLSQCLLFLPITRDQVPVALQSVFQFGNIIIVIILRFRLLFKAGVKVEGRPNSNSKGVNPLADCTVVLYTWVAKGTHSSQLV